MYKGVCVGKYAYVLATRWKFWEIFDGFFHTFSSEFAYTCEYNYQNMYKYEHEKLCFVIFLKSGVSSDAGAYGLFTVPYV